MRNPTGCCLSCLPASGSASPPAATAQTDGAGGTAGEGARRHRHRRLGARPRRFAARTGSPVAKDIVLWTRLRDGAGTWEEYGGFLARHPDWPGLQTLRRAGERQMPEGMPPERGHRLLRRRAAADRHRLAAAGRGAGGERPRGGGRGGDRPRLARVLDDRAGAQRHAGALARGGDAAHEARLDMLLWRGLTSEAEAMLPLVDEDWQRLAQARIACPARRGGAAVPDQHRAGAAEGRPGPRLRALSLPGREGALAGGRGLSPRGVDLGRAALGKPEMWMERRANLARQALEDGDVAGAYRIAAQNFGERGPGLCRCRVGGRASSR